MKKRLLTVLSVVMCVVLTVSIAVLSVNAEILYTDGDYTYADNGTDFVKLYGYSGESQTLKVPNNFNNREVTGISNFAFYKNETITAIDFSEASGRFSEIGMKSFAESALSGKLTLPSGVRSLGYGAFQDCAGISGVEFLSLVKDIPEQCFYNCDALQEVVLPINVESIGNLAFADCDSLYDVYLPAGVNSISPSAFRNTYFVTLHCYYGTYAYEYAKQHNLSYVLRDEYMSGDVNGDGVINVDDVTDLQRHTVKLAVLNELRQMAADVTHDGYLSIEDVTLIQRYIAEFDDAVL